MNFKEFCQKNMTALEYMSLSETLNCTKYTLTTVFNNPTKMDANMVLGFSKILGVEPKTLIKEYNLGIDKITIRDYLEIQ